MACHLYDTKPLPEPVMTYCQLATNISEIVMKIWRFSFPKCIWVRSWNCGCLVTWFCYQLIAKPGNKTATVSWSDPYEIVSASMCWWPRILAICTPGEDITAFMIQVHSTSYCHFITITLYNTWQAKPSVHLTITSFVSLSVNEHKRNTLIAWSMGTKLAPPTSLSG